MKDNKIDDLFRQKLGHQKLMPPPSAWAAVEQTLPKKKKGIYFWVSMAASILLICTLGWVVLRGDGATTPNNQGLSASNDQGKINKDNLGREDLEANENNNDQNKTTILKQDIEEPAPKQLVATSDKKKIKRPFKNLTTNNITSETPEPALTERELLIIPPLNLTENLSVSTTIKDFDFDMVMPLVLSDYYIVYNEELKLAPKKKRFRVLNGIMSIAKEVNNSKLSFSELRNRKNNFVNDDLKYGTKAEEETEDDSEDEPNKD